MSALRVQRRSLQEELDPGWSCVPSPALRECVGRQTPYMNQGWHKVTASSDVLLLCCAGAVVCSMVLSPSGCKSIAWNYLGHKSCGPRSLNKISDEAGRPPEFKHIIKGRKRN